MIALDPKDDWEFIPTCDRNLKDSEQTKFILKHLDAKEDAYLSDRLGQIKDGDYAINLGTQNLITLHIGLKDVINFKDAKGKQVKLKRNTKENKICGDHPLHMEFINRIPKEIRTEVAVAIADGSK